MSLSQAYASVHVPATSGLAGILRSARASFRQSVEMRRAQQRARDELDAYSDRQLQDLGISRADIPSVVAGTYGA